MASKSKRRRRVLGASCILAALIVGASSFAWFTSKDEVTNRLSANANYGAALAEDFTPPENFLPGQKVNKDVGVVNTGNIDTLVKVHVTGALNILKENAVASEVDVMGGGFTAPSTAVTDTNLTKLGLTLTDGSGNYFRTLSKTERNNPQTPSSTNDPATSDSNEYSEVESVQAGGYLAYASTGAAFKFTPESAGYTYRNAADTETITQASAAELTSSAIKNSWTNGVGLKVDTDTFLPTADGLYIFRRDVTESNVSGSEGTYYEYSGYYYKAASTDAGGQGTYYALHYLPNEGGTTYKSDYVIFSTKETAEPNGNALTVTYETASNKTTPVVSVVPTSVKLFSASYTRVENLVPTYDQGTASTVDPSLTFTNGSGNEAIIVKAYLDNVGVKAGSGSENWTEINIGTGTPVPYFYYNNDVEEGDSTAKLIDSVELDKNTKKSAYLAMDFDLNVLLDSVQVTVNENGIEQITAATESWTELGNNTVATQSNGEITSITWTTAST